MNNQIEVNGIIINLQKFNDSDYVSLTDIVKGQDENLTDTERPAHTIRYWVKNLNTLEFLEEWEIVHNDDFKAWIKETKAIGLIVKPGRYSGIFAHKDIALNFC